MDVVSTHTTKILEAIMIGDFDTVIKEAGAVSTMSEGMIKDFFPEGGKVGDWFKETGKNPENPADVKAVKDDFEKYMKAVADASKNIAETAKKYTIVETYKSFDAMLQKACFACHTVYRPLWPEWMKITGG
jgi:cytochrome c556